jgi:hypothetical protein
LEVKGTPKEPNALGATESSCLPFTPGIAPGNSTGEYPLPGWTELVSGGGKGFRYGLALLISNSVRPLWFDEELVTGTSESDWAETDKGTRNMEDSNPTPTAALFRGRNTFELFMIYLLTNFRWKLRKPPIPLSK